MIINNSVINTVYVRYYNWSTAAPLVLAMQVFQKPLPKVTTAYLLYKILQTTGLFFFFFNLWEEGLCLTFTGYQPCQLFAMLHCLARMCHV